MPSSRMPLLLLLLLVPLSMGGACRGPADDVERPIRIGAGSTAEQQVLAALSAGHLEREGHTVEIVTELGDTVTVRSAALDGRVDAFWDYTGAAWTLGLRLPAPAVDPLESFEAVAAEDMDNGLLWGGPSRADARLAFFIREQDRPDPAEATLTWLAGQLGQQDRALCADAAYLGTPAGFAHLADVYAIADEVTTIPAAEEASIARTAQGECLAGLATATSGEARGRGLYPLIDDQGVFPAMVIAPVVADGGRADDPDVLAALDGLAVALDTESLSILNSLVERGDPIDAVVADWLEQAALTAGLDGP